MKAVLSNTVDFLQEFRLQYGQIYVNFNILHRTVTKIKLTVGNDIPGLDFSDSIDRWYNCDYDLKFISQV